jgi:hypothetical protein
LVLELVDFLVGLALQYVSSFMYWRPAAAALRRGETPRWVRTSPRAVT